MQEPQAGTARTATGEKGGVVEGGVEGWTKTPATTLAIVSHLQSVRDRFHLAGDLKAAAVASASLRAVSQSQSAPIEVSAPWTGSVEVIDAGQRVHDALLARGTDDALAARVAHSGVREVLSLLDSARARNEQDRQQQSNLASADHAKYLSFLSHDLRGGLNGILLMIEVLKRDLADQNQFGPQLEDLDMMRRGVLDTVAQMDRLIYVQRFRNNFVRVREDRVNLASLADQVRVQFDSVASDRGRKLAISCPEPRSPQATVVGDRVLISLIMTGVLGSAIRNASNSITAPITICLEGKSLGWRLEVTNSEPAWLPSLPANPLEIGSQWIDELQSASDQIGLKLAMLAANAMNAHWSAAPGRAQIEKP